ISKPAEVGLCSPAVFPLIPIGDYVIFFRQNEDIIPGVDLLPYFSPGTIIIPAEPPIHFGPQGSGRITVTLGKLRIAVCPSWSALAQVTLKFSDGTILQTAQQWFSNQDVPIRPDEELIRAGLQHRDWRVRLAALHAIRSRPDIPEALFLPLLD